MVVVATPSAVNGGQYEFIQGKLDDLDRLPVLHGLQPASNGRSLYVNDSGPFDVSQSAVSPLRGMREGVCIGESTLTACLTKWGHL
jgi:hypothetical protein